MRFFYSFIFRFVDIFQIDNLQIINITHNLIKLFSKGRNDPWIYSLQKARLGLAADLRPADLRPVILGSCVGPNGVYQTTMNHL